MFNKEYLNFWLRLNNKELNNDKEELEQPPISKLPDEIINKIFSYLNFPTLKKVNLVDKKWNKLAQSNKKKLVKIRIKKDARTTAKNIQNFVISDQQDLIEIAKLCAEKDARATAEYIQNFEIDDQQALIKIAKICAKKNGWGTAEYIQNFGIDNQQDLFEIAKICARRDAEFTAEYVKNFGIRDQQALIEIATICAENNALATSIYIGNFGIKDQQGLIKIVQVCIEEDAAETAEQIKNFGICNQQSLIEIAKLCVEKDAEGAAKYIKNFGIRDQQALIEIAKICAEKEIKTLKYLKNFEIKDQYNLIEVAKIYFDKHTKNIQRLFDYFLPLCNDGILLLRGLILSPSTLKTLEIEEPLLFNLRNLENMEIPLNHENNNYPICQNALNHQIELLKEKFREEPTPQHFLKFLEGIKDLYAQKNALIWANLIILYFQMENVCTKKIAFLTPILKNLADYRFPSMRNLLTTFLMDFYKDPKIEEVQQEIIENNTPNHQKALLSFLLSCFAGSNIEKLKESTKICKNFFNHFYFYEDSKTGINQRMMVELLYHLHRNRKLTLNEKINILYVFAKDFKTLTSHSKKQKQVHFCNVMRRAQLALDLIKLGHAQKLKEITSYHEIDLQLEELYKNELGITSENFIEQYFKTLGQWRNQQAIWTYYATQKADGKNARLFKIFAQSVFDGSFKTMRYQNDLHLIKIYQTHPGIIDLWKKGKKISEQEFSRAPSLVLRNQSILTAKIISKKLKKCIKEEHLGKQDEIKANYPYLFEYLYSSGKGKNCNYYLKKIRTELAENQKTEGSQKLTFQLQFLQLEQIRDHDVKKKLNALLRNYPKDEKNIQFKQDIQNYLDLFSRRENSSSNLGWIVEDTDDPCDLLLLGTEVQTCQHISGNPSLNQGLLGYLLNGKNRAIVVKDRNENIIGRRLIRLLWDETTKMPVLFQEPYYASIEDEKIKQLVDEMCKGKAAQLGIPLLVKEGRESYPSEELYPFSIESLGGQCPVEYVDALKGIESAKYVINGCKKRKLI